MRFVHPATARKCFISPFTFSIFNAPKIGQRIKQQILNCLTNRESPLEYDSRQADTSRYKLRSRLQTFDGILSLKAILKGGKTSSEGSFKRRHDSNRAGFRREHLDNESCHASTLKVELEFADQDLDGDGPCCSTERIL